MRIRYGFGLCLMMSLVMLSCSSPNILVKGKRKELKKQIEQDPIFNAQFTGFALYDPLADSLLVAIQAHHYFTPASNTKLLTLYTSLRVMGDSMPLLHYTMSGDTMIIKGTGYPGTEYAPLPESHQLQEFLLASDKTIAYQDDFMDDAFGPGWSWADFQWYYQPERNAMPLFGNVVVAQGDSLSRQVRMSPPYFTQLLYPMPDATHPEGMVWRDQTENIFYYNGQPFDHQGYEREIPIHLNASLTRTLLKDLSGKPVLARHQPVEDANWQTLYADIPADSIYHHMMQVSDNFLAEQLLLMAAGVVTDTLQADKAIEYMLKGDLSDLPDRPQWVDGSGLSRYNLNTPASIVQVLQYIYRLKGLDWIKSIFAVGGISGTIKNWYAGPEGTPYVWAKTGSLLNNHCLSGFVQARSGKVYVFSFMNNHFTGSANQPRRSMQRVLEWIYWNG